MRGGKKKAVVSVEDKRSEFEALIAEVRGEYARTAPGPRTSITTHHHPACLKRTPTLHLHNAYQRTPEHSSPLSRSLAHLPPTCRSPVLPYLPRSHHFFNPFTRFTFLQCIQVEKEVALKAAGSAGAAAGAAAGGGGGAAATTASAPATTAANNKSVETSAFTICVRHIVPSSSCTNFVHAIT